MSDHFDGLYCVHLELTRVCNKECWMCGRRKVDRDYPEIAMNYGHMDFDLVKKIAAQVPKHVVVQFHNNGSLFFIPSSPTRSIFFQQYPLSQHQRQTSC
jgi:hypothetical protein